jgi:hypothetical protein
VGEGSALLAETILTAIGRAYSDGYSWHYSLAYSLP